MIAIKQRLMHSFGFVLIALLVACGGAGTGNGDGPDGPGGNGDSDDPGAPLSISVSAEPETVEVGGDVVLTARVAGEGATAAAVTWDADEGLLPDGTGESVTWTAPGNAGNYTVTATLSVGGESVSAGAQIAVTEAAGGPGAGNGDPEPLTVSVDASSARAVYGQSVTLTATVEGDGAGEAVVTWAAEGDAGEFSSDQGLTTVWTAPSTAGLVEITASIAGEAASDNASVVVVLCNSGSVNLADNPCVITNVQQLQAIGVHRSSHFALDDDIDAAVTASWNGGTGFDVIGDFSGTLNGRGFTISGLHVNRPDVNDVGLFSRIGSSGVVSNLSLSDAVILGGRFVGGIAGTNNGLIDSSSTSGTVTGADFTGGLVGSNSGAVEASDSTAVVTGNEYVGGLVGSNSGQGSATIHESFSNNRLGNEPGVRATGSNTGGLVGRNYGVITDSYSGSIVQSTGSNTGGLVGINLFHDGAGYIRRSYTSIDAVVAGATSVGGLVGDNLGFITQSYSLADRVEGTNRVGGLVGYHRTSTFGGDLVEATIDESYSMNVVAGNNDVGGLVGESMSDSDVTVTNSYWDMQWSQLTDSDGGSGVMTSQMRERTAFTNFDFADAWFINEGIDPPDLQSNPRPPRP